MKLSIPIFNTYFQYNINTKDLSYRNWHKLYGICYQTFGPIGIKLNTCDWIWTVISNRLVFRTIDDFVVFKIKWAEYKQKRDL
jgi:hypothetical protein